MPMGDAHPNWNWYALEGEAGERNTYVLEGWIDNALHDMTYTYHYRVLVTPRTSYPGQRPRRRLRIDRLSAGDVSDVELALKGRVSSRHRQLLVGVLDWEGVLPGVRDEAVAFILFLYTKTTSTYTFADEAVVRILTEEEEEDYDDVAVEDSMQEEDLRPTPADRDAVEGLEKLVVVSPGASMCMRETSCVICLSEFSTGSEVVRMPCSHVFHADCIARWLDNRFVCPLCRFELAHSKEETTAAATMATEYMVLDS